jgi:hypothetical protein
MHQLYLVMKVCQARKECPTLLEFDIASGKHTSDNPAVVAYFEKLGSDRKAAAEAHNVCIPFALIFSITSDIPTVTI